MNQTLPIILDAGRKTISDYLQRVMSSGEIPGGAVAIVANRDKLLFHEAFGLMNVANNTATQKDTIFPIASMTKAFTAVAAMMLHEEGLFALDDLASQYLPALQNPQVVDSFNPVDKTYMLRDAVEQITIRQLFTHTSGLTYSFLSEELFHIQQQTGQGDRELPLAHDPGTQWAYSPSTTFLGNLVEVLSGQKLDIFLHERIFNPLGMHDTSYVVLDEKHDRLTTVHWKASDQVSEEVYPKPYLAEVLGDRGINTTAADFVKFLQMLLNGGSLDGASILRQDSINNMLQNHLGSFVVTTQHSTMPAVSESFPLGAGQDKHGLGFQISVSNDTVEMARLPGNFSWSGGGNSHFWGDPKTGIAAVLLMQVFPFYDRNCIEAFKGFEQLIYRHLE